MTTTATVETLTDSERDLRTRLTGLAKDFFLRQGYSSSTMDQVSKTAKVSKKTIYKLFRTKEEVLRSVIHSIMHEIEDVTNPLYQDVKQPFSAKLERLVVHISPQYAQLRSPASIREMRIAVPAVHDEFDLWRRGRFQLFSNMLRESVDKGEVASDFDFDEMLAIYAAIHNSCMDYSILADAGVSADAAYRAFVDVFLNGLLDRTSPIVSKRMATSASSKDAV